MKKFLKTALPGVTVAASAVTLLLASAASTQAAYVANDLILGFNKGGGSGPADYVIDLGNANSVVGVGGSSAVNLSSFFNLGTFNGLYGGLAGVSMGVLGGNPATAGRDLYITSLRTSNFGSPTIAGSTAPLALASTPMANGVNDLTSMLAGLGLSAGGSATIAQSDPSSFFNNVLSTTPPSFLADTGRNPSGSVASGSVIYEDLYRAVPNGAFAYLGYFALDVSGNGSLMFTPNTVPEPSSGALFGVGLLGGWIYRRARKNQKGNATSH